jgi:TusE/DsrC/DsvC family sulfur relay protein
MGGDLADVKLPPVARSAATAPSARGWMFNEPGVAMKIGIDLTDAHWKAIRFLREDYKAQGETATLRRVSTLGGIPTKELFTLFPKKPAKKMAYIAGLPKSHGCV